ncbi:hypothetical protein M885DRAFT_552706 [Pelagophyceae sp. CCMP2097]|nr:hypothetical protein M885DRAFT_552706 [Pelagophyceae sp. CCMP2097]
MRFTTLAAALAVCHGLVPQPQRVVKSPLQKAVDSMKVFAFTATLVAAPIAPSFADGQTEKFVLPPVDFSDKSRCAFKSSAMGQANAARDKLYDLRQCTLTNSNADGYDLSGAILSEADFSGTSFRTTQFSKAYMKYSKFRGADFTNAVVDRVTFENADLTGAIFQNAVLTGASFDNANIEDVDFTDAFISDYELRKICRNPTLKGENPTTKAPTRESAGCR